MRLDTKDGRRVTLSHCFGLRGQGDGLGLAVRLEGLGAARWTPQSGTAAAEQAEAVWLDERCGLEARTQMHCLGLGLWRRQDSLCHRGAQALVLSRCLARFSFAAAHYHVYSQDSRWCRENQPVGEDLTHGERVLRGVNGRSCQGGTPYLCLADRDSGRQVAFHLEPIGNWVMRVRCVQAGGPTLSSIELDLGLSDDELALRLAPGERLDLPPVLIQGLPGQTPESGAPGLHAAVQANAPRFAAGAPLLYNTWFDDFDNLDTERLLRQAAAAREIGCETFVVDAGWYGQGAGWACQGDWREKLDRAFKGRLREFAGAVRALGLRFGLWMEPEAIRPGVPVTAGRPPWLLAGPGGALWPDLTHPEGRGWVRGEILRLIETYGVEWLKIDFNAPIGPSPSGDALYGYYQRWSELLDEIRERCPQTYLENCASGGQRLDLTSLRHYHGHFLSDTVDPIDTLRILQGALLRMPPGPLVAWTVLRPAGPGIPEYGQPLSAASPCVLTPCGATWERCATVDLDFAMAVSCAVNPGLSGDLAGLDAAQRQRLARWAGFAKTWRVWRQDAVADLLTPPRPLEDRDGWVALHLRRAADPRSLLFVYRLDDPRAELSVVPRGLDRQATYRIAAVPDGAVSTLGGAALLDDGLRVTLAKPRRAAVFVLERCGE